LIPASIGLAAKEVETADSYKIEVKDNWMQVNGEKFFVKAIMYSPAYPGEMAENIPFNKKRLRNDFQMIKTAGFNTIKTRYSLSPKAVDVAKSFGLFVIQGIGLDYKGDFVTQDYLNQVATKITGELKKTAEKDNILFYCLGMEPDADLLTKIGKKNVKQFFSLIKEMVNKRFPDERIVLNYKTQTGFPFIDLWDVGFVALHPCHPVSVKHALGYYGMANWIKKVQVSKQPLILNALRFSLYPGRKERCGCRGLTPEEQSKELITFYSDAVDAGVTGLCIADWRDAWWKKHDEENDHLTQDDNDPCEWLGITYSHAKKKKVMARPALGALSQFNKMLVINPKSYDTYSEDLVIEVFIENEIDICEYRISGKEEWHALKKLSSHWLHDVISKDKLEKGRQVIEFRGWKRVKKGKKKSLKKTHKIVCRKEKIIYFDKDASIKTPQDLILDVKKEVLSKSVQVKALCHVKDIKGNPVADQEITYAISNPLTGLEVKGKKISDEKGQATIVFASNEPGIYSLAAGTPKGNSDFPRIKTCDLEYFSALEGLFPEQKEFELKAPVIKLPEKQVEEKDEKTAQKDGPNEITIKDDWVYVNGERFFIKGIGYSPAYPGELPWKRGFNEKRMRRDFELIKKAGFNALRTWIPLKPEEIDLAREYGFFILQGVWVNYTGNFVSEQGMMGVVNKFYQEVERTKDKDNILLYLLGNEPLPSQLFAVGLEKTDQFFLDLKNNIKEQMPNARVSIANWVQSDFLNTRIWDTVCINLYPYYPESVNHSLGYYGYTDWVKRVQSPKKPLILTELGLSVSLGRRGTKGYGGNTEKDQKEGIIDSYEHAVDAGVCGVCIFEWMDEWWKNFDYGEDQQSHEENDPEEWFGIAYYDMEKKEFITRPAYDAVSEFNKAIVIQPKSYSKQEKDFAVEVFVNDDVDVLEYRIDASEWKKLTQISPLWMKANVSVSDLKNGKHTCEIRAWKQIEKDDSKKFKKTHKIICEKKKTFFVDKKALIHSPYSLTLNTDSDVCFTKGEMTTINVTCKVTDSNGNPVPNKEVMYSITEPLASQALRSQKKTNAEGELQMVYFVNEPGIISFAAGTEMVKTHAPEIKVGDIKHISVFYNEMSKFRRLKCITDVTNSDLDTSEEVIEKNKDNEKRSEEKVEDKKPTKEELPIEKKEESSVQKELEIEGKSKAKEEQKKEEVKAEDNEPTKEKTSLQKKSEQVSKDEKAEEEKRTEIEIGE